VLGGTDNLITKAAALVSAIGVLVAAGALFLHGSPAPAVIEASFLEAKAEPNVSLGVYEEGNKTGAVAEREVPPHWALDRLAVDTASMVGAAQVRILVDSTAGRLLAAASPSVTPSSSQPASQEAQLEESETLAKEAQAKQAQAQEETEERNDEAKAEEAKIREEQSRHEEEGPVARTNLLTEQRLREEEQARLEAEARQAKTKVEQAKVIATEQTTIAKEEKHPTVLQTHTSAPPLHREGDARVGVGTGASTGEVDDVLEKAGIKLPAPCSSSCGLRSTVDKAIADYSNPKEAAREVADVFGDLRITDEENRSELDGEIVEYAIHIVGYAGKPMKLYWSLYSKRTGRPLPREWCRDEPAGQITPLSDSARVVGKFWAPVPRESGDYDIQLRVFSEGSEVAHTKTNPFD
jgi:hypothetical protein